tara:strand:+ start:311 stop:1081 length:771 start_codon:yes stop_codon:yes gene_type:complete
MATYKKRGAKKSLSKKIGSDEINESKTAEVFDSLDITANKTEDWVVKYQNIILILIGTIAVCALSYLGYQNMVYRPMAKEAISELNQAQYYFDLAINNYNESDSLFKKSLNGGDGKFGFLDIINKYKGTPAAKLARYSAGMAYLNLKEYKNAIIYLDEFSSDDVLLSSLSKGAIGDAFSQINQPEEAYQYYLEAAKINNNLYSTPKYLFKAAMIGVELDKITKSLSYLMRIKKEFPESEEANYVDVQIAKLKTLLQ